MMGTLWPERVVDRPGSSSPHREVKAELFIYRSYADKAVWDYEGATPMNRDSMVFFTFEGDVLCAVADGETVKEVDRLFAAITSDTLLFD